MSVRPRPIRNLGDVRVFTYIAVYAAVVVYNIAYIIIFRKSVRYIIIIIILYISCIHPKETVRSRKNPGFDGTKEVRKSNVIISVLPLPSLSPPVVAGDEYNNDTTSCGF